MPTECYHCESTITPGESRRPFPLGVGHPGEQNRHVVMHESCGQYYHRPQRATDRGQRAIVVATEHGKLIPWGYEGVGETVTGWVRYPPVGMEEGVFDIDGATWTTEKGAVVMYADSVTLHE